MRVLLINACVRPQSRTKALCDAYLDKLKFREAFDLHEVRLSEEGLCPLTYQALLKRDWDIASADFSSPAYQYAKDLTDCDLLLIAAPYWDGSFPSSLKVWFEHATVNRLVFRYDDKGQLIPLCKAKKVVFFTTAGGFIGSADSGERYIRDMAGMYGIGEVEVYKAEGLDIIGTDVSASLECVIKSFSF